MNAPLLAAGWIESLGPLLLVLFWVLRQVFEARREVEVEIDSEGAYGEEGHEEGDFDRLEEEPALYGEAAMHSPAGNAGQTAPSQMDPVQTEIQEFLRKIGQAQHGEPTAPRLELPAELIVEEEPAVRRSEVGALSHEHLAESQLAEQAAHLGERIAQADDRLDARLHKTFDHQLGQFQNKPTVGHRHEDAIELRPSAAARVAKMLTTPAGIKDAVVLSEILRRPSD